MTAAPTSAGATTLYAYRAGAAVSPTICPQTATTSQQCTLAQALLLASAGNTVALATPGTAGHYVGNWTLSTKGTSAAAPLSIEPATGVSGPVLDGNYGKPAGCQTKTCDGPVLTIGPKVHADIYGLTVQDADNTLTGDGGAVQNDLGGTLSVSACTFLRDSATKGGAIDNTAIAVVAKNGTVVAATGTVSISGSTFTANTATGSGAGPFDGGAIDNADGGFGTVTVSGSTFTANTAGYGPAVVSGASAGGAIDSADNGGRGTLVVSASTFSANRVRDCPGECTSEGGAINSADNGGSGTLAVSASTFTANSAHAGGAICNGAGAGNVSASVFSANTADYGAAIDNGDSGTGTLAVSASTFSANRAEEDGGAIANGYTPNTGTLAVSASTFFGNLAAGNPNDPDIATSVPNGYGGAIYNGTTRTLAVSASTFSANTAKDGGGTINNFFSVWAAADIFNGGCHEAAGATWADEGYNVGAGATCLKAGTGDASHGAGHLGPLAHNGGPTETMLALAANPAIGVVPLDTTVKLHGRSVTLCPTIDQRGVRSAPGKACNAGAVQSAS